MFIDRAKIFVKAGDGGDGCVAFRREKFVPRGGPSGGDGGDGGSVFVRSNPQLNTLLPFKYKQHIRAGRGGHGSGSRRHGKKGLEAWVDVPLGTEVYDAESGQLLFDLDKEDRVECLATGGRGGRGNVAFASSTNQAPRRFEKGWPGEEKVFQLELKLLADIGIVGLPNAGKSTLISVLSAAKPKIADYPFTTVTPNLGVVSFDDFSSFVVTDIPGLIEGAHQGLGLGDHFLRHVERTRALVHLVDTSVSGLEDPVAAVEIVSRELELYNPLLLKKKCLLVASKVEIAVAERLKLLREYCDAREEELLEVSSLRGDGLASLKGAMFQMLQGEP